ncbi:MAG: ABC transporter substrate-binding protein [Balneolaceae bacterium]
MTFLKRHNLSLLFIIPLLFWACTPPQDDSGLQDLSWDEIVEEARGGSLTLMMWMGDTFINDYMNNFVVPRMKERYDIDLNIVSGQGTQVVSTLMGELESGRRASQIDQMWINGETFFQLREIDALFGPFTESLPNARYVNFDNPFIGYDFQQPVDGYEAPWGNVQLALIYNPDQVSNLPHSLDEFETWVNANPGRFTIPTEFTGMTFLKSMMISLADDSTKFHGPFSEDVYQRYSTELWDRLNEIKSNFWRQGRTFPNSVAQLHQLFSNGEIAFTMSNNDSEVDNKIAQGLFPPTSRAYVPRMGTIQNSHYMGIPKHAGNKAEALVTINFLMSPEAQFEKMKPDVWGDATILNIDSLPDEWQQRFAEIPGRQQAPDRSEIQPYALMEPDPEYMIRIFEDFRREVVN